MPPWKNANMQLDPYETWMMEKVPQAWFHYWEWRKWRGADFQHSFKKPYLSYLWDREGIWHHQKILPGWNKMPLPWIIVSVFYTYFSWDTLCESLIFFPQQWRVYVNMLLPSSFPILQYRRIPASHLGHRWGREGGGDSGHQGKNDPHSEKVHFVPYSLTHRGHLGQQLKR